MIKAYTLALLILILPNATFADWSKPKEIIKGTWGSSDKQFGITPQDDFDMIPGFDTVTTENKIIIRDGPNSRIKVYDSSGTLELMVPYTANLSYKELTTAPLYGFTGDFVGHGVDGHHFFYRADYKAYILYTPTGTVLKTLKEWPAELGVVDRKRISKNKYAITLTFPDKIYRFTRDNSYELYRRDGRGNINAILGKTVIKLDPCGTKIGSVTIPPENRSEYGDPVLAPNGDVYTWRRSSDLFSIIKWNWIEDQKANSPSCTDQINIKR